MKNKNILICDDDDMLREIVSFKLSGMGFRVRKEADALAALAAIQDDMPDLLILDAMMPGMSGYELLRRIRSDISTRSMRVLMLSARSQERDVVAALGDGANDYVTKPFSPRELAARVERTLATPA